MDRIIDSHFERVERALDTLIKSIGTYNPNPAHAESLVAADEELSRGLEQLTTHQSNHAKITSLRATTTTLDTQIHDTLNLLSSTRRDLLSAPSTSAVPAKSNPILYAELLSYARRISKFTLPPTHREANATEVESAGMNSETQPLGSQILPTNGNASPTPHSSSSFAPAGINVTNGDHHLHISNTSMDIDTTPTPSQQHAQPSSQSTTIATNNTKWAAFLNPRPDMPWTPWPTEDTIRRGALASIQLLLEQGRDPATFDPDRSAELEEERRLKMEAEERARAEEEERRRDMERIGQGSGHAGGGARPAEKPKVFQLEDFEDEDD